MDFSFKRVLAICLVAAPMVLAGEVWAFNKGFDAAALNSGIESIESKYVNKDSLKDLVVTEKDGSKHIFLGNLDGSFKEYKGTEEELKDVQVYTQKEFELNHLKNLQKLFEGMERERFNPLQQPSIPEKPVDETI